MHHQYTMASLESSCRLSKSESESANGLGDQGDHRQQSFTVAHLPTRLRMKKPEYTFTSAFYVLIPLLNAVTPPALRRMICEAYDIYTEFISLSIEEQRGLMFVGAFTAHDAVDSINEWCT